MRGRVSGHQAIRVQDNRATEYQDVWIFLSHRDFLDTDELFCYETVGNRKG